MSDKELFEEVVKRFAEKYNVVVETPYDDGYRIFKLKSGYELGDFNSDGYNLLHNLTKLCNIFRHELK